MLSPMREMDEKWEASGLEILGGSVAGVGTCFKIPELGVILDVANGPDHSLEGRTYLITHGHSDHAGGIPYILSQRALNKRPVVPMYMPKEMIEPLTEIVKLWQRMEGHEYEYDFRPVDFTKGYALKPDWVFRAFKTFHRVPSQGYTLFHRNKKLRPEFSDRSGREIAELRKQGEEIEEIIETPWITYTGDTTIELLDECPDFVRKSKTLLLEATYVNEKRSVEKAHFWGHIHLDELVKHLPKLEVEDLVLIHASRRHSRAELREAIKEKIPMDWKSRVRLGPYV